MVEFTKGVGFEKDLVRLPGQSVNDQLLDYMNDKVDFDLLGISISITLLFLVWIGQVVPLTSNPVLFSIILISAILVFIYRLRKAMKRVRHLRQGRDGERYVGQILDEMRVDGSVTFHDVLGDNFNIDHVVIGPKGVYVIETKTWSKGSAKGSISYKDGVFKLNGRILDKNPLDQAKANAKWFVDFLKESTGRVFPVQSVVVLPGWYIEKEDTMRALADGVLMLNPKALSAFVKNSKRELTEEDLHLVAYHTSRHIKTSVYS